MPRCVCYHGELTIYVIDLDRFVSDERPSMEYRNTGMARKPRDMYEVRSCHQVSPIRLALMGQWLCRFHHVEPFRNPFRRGAHSILIM